MKIAELRIALAKLGPEHDNKELLVWMPGSRIYLGKFFLPTKDNNLVLLEGNLLPGSALERN